MKNKSCHLTDVKTFCFASGVILIKLNCDQCCDLAYAVASVSNNLHMI